MLNLKTHDQTMRRILVAIYSNTKLQNKLAFKGGTCLYMFYGLDRFSTDLDFNIIGDAKEFDPAVVTEILKEFLDIQKIDNKHSTWLWKGQYEKGGYGIKLEISKRDYPDTYKAMDFFGYSIPTMTPDCMFAHKLCAILDRSSLQNRDLYDTYFMLKKSWPINQKIIGLRNKGMSKNQYIDKLIAKIPKLLPQKNSILEGLGEVLDAKQKAWVKENLVKSLLFELEIKKD
jgi:predicted nucleotidyltransferase component of viral defense system